MPKSRHLELLESTGAATAKHRLVRAGISVPKRPHLNGIAATAFAAGSLLADALLDGSGPPWLTVLGVALLVISMPLIALPFFHLARRGGKHPGRPFYDTTRPVVSGVYRVVRHPQYSGYMLLLSGLAAINAHPLTWGLTAGSVVFFYRQAIVEERSCLTRFGDEYRQYVAAVPRLNLPLGLFRMFGGSGSMPE